MLEVLFVYKVNHKPGSLDGPDNWYLVESYRV